MKYKSSMYNMLIKEENKNYYVYNSFTSSYVILDEQTYLAINKEVDSENPCNYFEELKKQGLIVPIEKDEYNAVLMQERAAIYDSSKKKMLFLIAMTMACNLKCKYCFENIAKERKAMSEKTADDIVKFIISQLGDDTQEVAISWFGGEPLLEYNKILKIAKGLQEELTKRNIKLASRIITNGVLFTRDVVQEMIEKCGLNSVQITIDGTKSVYCEQKGATEEQFEIVLKNIKDALDYMPVYIRLNCNGNNYDDLKEIATKIGKENENRKHKLMFYFARIIDYSNHGDTYSLDHYLKDRLRFEDDCAKDIKVYNTSENYYPRRRKCFCGFIQFNNYIIGPSGELYKCDHMIGRRNEVVGDIYNGYYYTSKLEKFIENPRFEKCKTCKLFPICLGGCPEQRNSLGEGKSCTYTEEFIKEFLNKKKID